MICYKDDGMFRRYESTDLFELREFAKTWAWIHDLYCNGDYWVHWNTSTGTFYILAFK